MQCLDYNITSVTELPLSDATRRRKYIHGLAQDHSYSIDNALELLQSYMKPSIRCQQWLI